MPVSSREQNKAEVLKNHEIKANKNLAIACLVVGAILTILYIFFVTGAFGYTNQHSIELLIAFPVDVVLLITAYIWSKTKIIQSSNFKYFLIVCFSIAVSAINIILPKHGIIGWPLLVVLTSFYYSPKLRYTTFGITLVLMLVCMYVGALVGEWDANLMNGSQDMAGVWLKLDGAKLGSNDILELTYEQRIEWLNSDYHSFNRWLAIFVYYYIPRALITSILFFVVNQQAKRTKILLRQEVNKITSEQKIGAELTIASDIQAGTLPRNFPLNERYELFAQMTPAKEVGGDFYDFFDIGESKMGFLIADVSGKGVPAAMFMMRAKTLIKTLAQTGMSADAVMTTANKNLCLNNDNNMFVTCWFGILDTATGDLEYVNAGHNPPAIKRENKEYCFLKDKAQFVLGAFDSVSYTSRKAKMLPCDEIFLYTDGVTEATNEKGEFYKEERLLNALNGCGLYSAEILIEYVKNDIDKFANGSEQADDITMLLFHYFGLDRKEFDVEANLENQEKMSEFVSNYVKKYGASDKIANQYKIVIDELFSNAVYYSKFTKDRIYVVLNKKDDLCEMIFLYKGDEFNPLEKENPDVTLSAEDRQVGGLGIFIVKNIMDNMFYLYRQGYNFLVMYKKII